MVSNCFIISTLSRCFSVKIIKISAIILIIYCVFKQEKFSKSPLRARQRQNAAMNIYIYKRNSALYVFAEICFMRFQDPWQIQESIDVKIPY